jgi:hypothetical protein
VNVEKPERVRVNAALRQLRAQSRFLHQRQAAQTHTNIGRTSRRRPSPVHNTRLLFRPLGSVSMMARMTCARARRALYLFCTWTSG